MNSDGGRTPGASGNQRSVAELLAAYGAESRREGPGRSDPEARRRRAAVADGPPTDRPGRSPVQVPVLRATGPAAGYAPPSPAAAPAADGGSSATEAIPVPSPADDAETGAFAASPARAARTPHGPDADARGGTATLRRTGPPVGPGRVGAPHPRGRLDDDLRGGPAGDPGDRFSPDLDDGDDDAPYDAYDAHDAYDDDDAYDDVHDEDRDDDVDEEPGRAGAREWVSFTVQVVAGAILGAVLWTAFSYLWKYLPPVALVLALVSTTGLVFGVRAMRRSDDLRTTVLAVVVGLLVTVTPAMVVLLLSPTG